MYYGIPNGTCRAEATLNSENFKPVALAIIELCLSEGISPLCTYQCQAPPTPGRAEVGIDGDLQMLDDKFPTPGSFKLQIPY